MNNLKEATKYIPFAFALAGAFLVLWFFHQAGAYIETASQF